MTNPPIEIPASYSGGLESDERPYPDIPMTEMIHPQRRAARAEGETYTTIEYIEVHQGLPVGPAGPIGPTGPAGADGGEWLVGSLKPGQKPEDIFPEPPNSPNDKFIDALTGKIWNWIESDNPSPGYWEPSKESFVFPPGPTGPQGDTGPKGDTGPTGPTGGGIKIVGTYENYPNCTNPPPNDGNLIGDGMIDSCGNLWAWFEDKGELRWYNFGPIEGPQGLPGPGSHWEEIKFDFRASSNPVYAEMFILVPDKFAGKRPMVNVLIDFESDGNFSTTGVVSVTYMPDNRIRLVAERSIMAYNDNGRGLVMLQ